MLRAIMRTRMADELEKHLIDEEETYAAQQMSPDTRKKFLKFAGLSAAFALVLALGFVGGLRVGAASSSDLLTHVPFLGDGLNATPDATANFTDFWKVWNVLNDRFVQTHGSTTPSVKERLYGAMAGLAASYGDPYTVFMPPEQSKVFQETISGEFGGVGMEMDVKDKRLTVIAPLKESPAERAGVRAGDLVAAIDGKSTDGMPIDAAVKLIRGKKGTDVKLTLIRDGEVHEITITRDTIQVPTIKSSYDAKTGIFTISIYEFTATAANLFDKALVEFRSSGARKLIIDVRGDPGGYLDAAVAIASHFLPEGTTIVTEDYKGKQQNLVHRSRGTGGIPEGTKVVVLMDKGSASASEILAGALKDNGVATLIGTRSFGKGSVQELVDIGGGSLKVTIARWLTPSGRSISDGGLTPDVDVDRTAEDFKANKDPQLDRAVEFLTNGK